MYIMQAEKNNFKRVFYHSAIDWKDDTEEKFERSRVILNRLVGNVSEREAHDVLTSAACRDQKTHDDICLGLLATILTDPPMAPKCFRDLNFLTRDSLSVVIDQLVIIAVDKYQKLTDVSRQQVVWVVRELVRAGVNSVDILCWNLMRQIAGGDVSNRNLWLAESMLDIYSENRSWLEKYPVLIASVIYTYLRILEDHTSATLSSLKQKEVNFIVGLIRDHFNDVCMNQQVGMGRDFLRLLQSISRIPEIETLWKDIYGNSNALDAQLTSRTSRKYLQSRLTPDMEKKISFLTTQVRFGMQKRYQEWFQRQYLSTPESQTLRADIIRFIVGVIHPTNEVLCSDIIPRWAVIGWLLTTCTHPVAAANAKLALFYDWLVFDPVKDNIMNVEPGILVMFNSLRSHPSITATLLDFLVRLSIEYWPAGGDKIKDGIGSALRAIIDKKVMPTLEPLLENPKLDPELRVAIQEHLLVLLNRKDKNQQGRLLPGPPFVDPMSFSPSVERDVVIMDVASPTPLAVTPSSTPPVNAFGGQPNSNKMNHDNNSESSSILTLNQAPAEDVDFSPDDEEEEEEEEDNDDDDEEEEEEEDEEVDMKEGNNLSPSTALAGALPARNSPIIASSVEEAEKSKIFEIIQGFPTNLRMPFESLLNDSNEESGEYIDEVLEDISDRSVDAHERQGVAKCLRYIFKSDLSKPCIQRDSAYPVDNFSISPVNEIAELILELKVKDNSTKKKNLTKLLADLINLTPPLGYKLLFLLDQLSKGKRSVKNQENYPGLYKNLCQYRSLKLEAALYQDLKNCWEHEPNLVGFISPIMYTWYDNETVGSVEILRTVVSALDPYQLQENMWKIMQEEFYMIDENALIPLLTKTLDWETWEQHCVWQLLSAHPGFTVDDYLPLIPQLDAKNNAEALTYLLLILKQEKPTGEILAPLLCRKPNVRDRFVISLLLHWSNEGDDDGLAETLATVLVRASGSPVKRKRGATGGRGTASPAGPATPTMENVLAHLEQLRVALKARDESEPGVFSKDPMQAALLQVQSWVTDTQKTKYKDLLELAAVEESETSSSRSTSKRNSARKMPSSPTPSNQSSLSRTRSGKTRQTVKGDSDESSDEDDEVVSRPRSAKKRKKASVYMSDSD